MGTLGGGSTEYLDGDAMLGVEGSFVPLSTAEYPCFPDSTWMVEEQQC